MNWINRKHSELLEFQRSNKAFAWSLWIAVGIAWTVLPLLGLTAHSFLVGAVSTLVTGYATLWVCANRWKALTARIEAVDQGIWSVAVNGVRAGEISDTDYARILRSVEFDLRTHITQILHFITRCYRIFTHMVIAGPIVFFWGVVLFWLSSPTEFSSTLDSLKVATSADVQASIPTLVSLFGVWIALYVGVLFMWRGGFRFAKFDDAIAAEVLQSIGCPATGQVTLSQFRQGSVGDKFEFVN